MRGILIHLYSTNIDSIISKQRYTIVKKHLSILLWAALFSNVFQPLANAIRLDRIQSHLGAVPLRNGGLDKHNQRIPIRPDQTLETVFPNSEIAGCGLTQELLHWL